VTEALAAYFPIVAVVGLWLIWAWSRVVAFGFAVLAVVVGIALLIQRARADDTYYGSSAVSVWEHAGRSGTRGILVGAIVLSVLVLAMLLRAIWRRSVGRFAWVAVAGASVALLSQTVAAFAISTFH
jgi:hypothetical protein